jgi:hypothetical protein
MTAATTQATTRATTAATPRSSAAASGGLLEGATGLTLGPVSAGEFLDSHWEQQPLLVPRDEPGRFDEVLSLADAEHLVCDTALRMPAFRLAKDGESPASSTYTEDITWRPGSFAQVADVGRVATEYARGATVILQALHLHWRPAAVYCRGLELELGWPTQANAYLTPASSRGFAVHHDTHDVFVLQVSGSKRWRIYDPVVELPLKGQRWLAETHGGGEPVQEFTLSPGDTLYIPRGWPHEATSAETDSLHLTVGLHAPTRFDALRDAIEACARDDIDFRRALGRDGVPEELLGRLKAHLQSDQTARRMRHRFLDSRRPILDEQLSHARAVDALDVDDCIERRRTVIADLEESDDTVALRFEGKEVIFPRRVRAAVAAVHGARSPFRPAELPGPLDREGRLTLVRRLVLEGFLRRV